MKKVLPWWVRWACRSGTVKNIFYSPYTFSLPLSPSQAGQAAVLGHLSHSMFLCSETSQNSSVSCRQRYLRITKSPEDSEASQDSSVDCGLGYI